MKQEGTWFPKGGSIERHEVEDLSTISGLLLCSALSEPLEGGGEGRGSLEKLLDLHDRS